MIVAGGLSEPGGDESADKAVSFEELGEGFAVVFGEGFVLGSGGEMETIGHLMELGAAPSVSVAEDTGETFWCVFERSGQAAGDLVVDVLESERDFSGLEKQGAGLVSVPDSPFFTGSGGEVGDGLLKSIAAAKTERKLPHIL